MPGEQGPGNPPTPDVLPDAQAAQNPDTINNPEQRANPEAGTQGQQERAEVIGTLDDPSLELTLLKRAGSAVWDETKEGGRIVKTGSLGIAGVVALLLSGALLLAGKSAKWLASWDTSFAWGANTSWGFAMKTMGRKSNH